MNAVEIEEAISKLAEQPFEPGGFPFAFLEAFGNKAATIKRLRSGTSNKSDIGGVLQTSNIHIKTCAPSEVAEALAALRASPANKRAKAKFILATDGEDFEAEDLISGETVACAYIEFPDHFGFFLPLAGISTVKLLKKDDDLAAWCEERKEAFLVEIDDAIQGYVAHIMVNYPRLVDTWSSLIDTRMRNCNCRSTCRPSDAGRVTEPEGAPWQQERRI